jgi:transposase
MRSIGLDLSTREISFCEVSNDAVVARRTVRDLDELEDLLGPDTPSAVVAIEACREAWYIHDTLQAKGHRVVIVDTTRVKQLGIGHHGRKRDSIDAEVLAFAVARERIPRAHVLSPHRRLLREKLNARRTLVEMRATLCTTIRGIVRGRGEKLGGCDTEDFLRKLRLVSLDDEARDSISPLATVIETLNIQLSKVESELEVLAAKEPVIAQLTSAPGVDLVVAAVFVSVIDEAKRFPDAHKVQSYLGLVPREDTTGGRDKQKLGSITKCGNPYARATLVQAAWCIYRSRRADPLRNWARAVERRRGKRIAVIALARRLAGVLWAMWRDGQPYNPSHLTHGSLRANDGDAFYAADGSRVERIITSKAVRRARKISSRVAKSTASSTSRNSSPKTTQTTRTTRSTRKEISL